MKLKMSRQTALKGLLLMVLAANVSWDPALKSLMESDYASAGSDTGGKSAPGQTRASGSQNLSQSPNGVKPSDSGPQPDAPARARSEEKPIRVAIAPEKPADPPAKPVATETHSVGPLPLNVCEGKSHVVIYREKHDSEGRLKTVGYVYESFGSVDSNAIIARSAFGSMNQWVEDTANRSRFESELKKNLAEKLGDSCRTEADKSKDREEKQKESEAEKARIAADMKKCLVDRHGNDLSESQRMECHIKALNSIHVSAKNESESRRQAMAELERIVNGELKKHLKSRLLSKDESKAEEGNDLVDEVIDSVESVAAVNDLDKRRTEKLINGLRAMKEGGKFNRQANELADKAKSLKDDYSSAWKDYQEAYQMTKTDPLLRNNPMLAMQMMQNAAQPINSLYWQHYMLSQQADQTLSMGYRNLLSMQSAGALSALDMRDYVSPFRTLRQDLMGMLDPKSMGITGIGALPDNPYSTVSSGLNSISLANLPNDFMSIRSGNSQAFRRSYGVSLPGLTNSPNMGNYGLSSVRSNPALPSSVFNSTSINIRPTTGYGGRSATIFK